ncbi:NlpC/P60 family protein [Blautia coccoides]|uniref:C40 family peptidase n=1 Tax=Blautia producta TaxID=33035 RepID=UPI00214A1D7A|nr:NlpC/P60 family protein [Blautia coccoides]
MKRIDKVKWKKGNGTLVFGTFMMLTGLCIAIMFIQTFCIRQVAGNTQTAADSVADGTATYLVNNGGDYNKAVEKANEIKSLIKTETGVDTDNLEIDKSILEDDNTVQVKLSTTTPYLTRFHGGTGQDYTIFKTSSTAFTGFTGGPLLSIGENKLGCLYYWGAAGPDMFDCSGYISWCYAQAGSSGERHTTDSLVAKFAGTQYEVSVADMQPGDVIICNGINHVVFYYGNGLTLGCSGGGSGTLGNNPNACVKFQNYAATYQSNTTHVFRIPVEAY